MKAEAWLATATDGLLAAGIDSARLDALILLEDMTGRDRAWLLAHPDSVLTTEQLEELAAAVERRLQHEPLAYIRGHAEFYGRRFEVTPDVLVPRPETEAMIDLLKQLLPNAARTADIGTGSGALAVTAALETGCEVAATDVDQACLDVAGRNARNYQLELRIFAGDLLEPFLQPGCDFVPDVLLANLPYVPDSHPINEAAKHEPELALFGGNDGLDLYRQMFVQTQKLPKLPQLILTEALPEQHEALASVAKTRGYRQVQTKDLIQAFCPADS